MKASLIAIYHVRGAARFADGLSEHSILAADGFRATLTDNPDAAFDQLDRGDAVARLVLTVLTGTDDLTPQQFIERSMADAKAERARKAPSGLFLVIEGERDVEILEAGAMRAMGEYGLALEAMDKAALRASFATLMDSTVTAIVAALPARSDAAVVPLGETVVLHAEQPLYAYDLKMTASLSVGTVVGSSELESATMLARELARNTKLTHSVRLHALAGTSSTDKPLAVLAAWAALEVFVNATFKEHYSDAWYELLKEAAPSSAGGIVERFEDVMRDKLRLADKFGVMASILDPDGAAADIATFNTVKKNRDAFFHALNGDRATFPVEDAIRLYRKYLTLHLDRGSAGLGRR